MHEFISLSKSHRVKKTLSFKVTDMYRSRRKTACFCRSQRYRHYRAMEGNRTSCLRQSRSARKNHWKLQLSQSQTIHSSFPHVPIAHCRLIVKRETSTGNNLPEFTLLVLDKEKYCFIFAVHRSYFRHRHWWHKWTTLQCALAVVVVVPDGKRAQIERKSHSANVVFASIENRMWYCLVPIFIVVRALSNGKNVLSIK